MSNPTRFGGADGVACEKLSIGAKGAEVAITATPAEINKIDGLATGIPIPGSRFSVSFPNIAAASVAFPFFIAPAACKIIAAEERHITVCDAADTMQIEKCTAGEAPGAGDELLASAFTLNSTANTAVEKAAVTTAAATLAKGDALLLKFKTGDGTNYAGACVTVMMEWV